MNNVCGKPTEK